MHHTERRAYADEDAGYSVAVDADRSTIIIRISIDRAPVWFDGEGEIVAPGMAGHVESILELAGELVEECDDALTPGSEPRSGPQGDGKARTRAIGQPARVWSSQGH